MDAEPGAEIRPRGLASQLAACWAVCWLLAVVVTPRVTLAAFAALVPDGVELPWVSEAVLWLCRALARPPGALVALLPLALGLLPALALGASGRRAVYGYGLGCAWALSLSMVACFAVVAPRLELQRCLCEDPGHSHGAGRFAPLLLLVPGALTAAVAVAWARCGARELGAPRGPAGVEAARVAVAASPLGLVLGGAVAGCVHVAGLRGVPILQVPAPLAAGLTAAGAAVLLVAWLRLRRPPGPASQG